MKTIISGSRSITDIKILEDVMEKYLPRISEVVSGMAKGVDELGMQWAKRKGIPVTTFPAQWSSLGKKAGAIRNTEMAEYADCAVILWDGKSKGTKHMINVMTRLKKPFYLVTLTDFVDSIFSVEA